MPTAYDPDIIPTRKDRFTWQPGDVVVNPPAKEKKHERHTVAGLDWWQGQWVVVVLVDEALSSVFIAADIKAALLKLTDAEVIGIDIPIGLPLAGEERAADLVAKAMLGKNQSSVFMTACRELLESRDHAAANILARDRGWKGITAQAFNLRIPILQVAEIALADERIHEIHPEVSFRLMSDEKGLDRKKSWNGMNQRRNLLANQGIMIPSYLSSGGNAGIDDVLDAAACAWSAYRISCGVAQRLPSGGGRAPAIWA